MGSPNRRNIILALLLIVLIIMGVARFMQNRTAVEQEDWTGTWKFYYFYESDTNLVYRGTMHIESLDSTTVSFETYAPKSSKAEKLQGAFVVKNGNQMKGVIAHDLYKINGGTMQESFDFVFGDDGTFTGNGQCLDYCAEGTERVPIFWHGSRTPE